MTFQVASFKPDWSIGGGASRRKEINLEATSWRRVASEHESRGKCKALKASSSDEVLAQSSRARGITETDLALGGFMGREVEVWPAQLCEIAAFSLKRSEVLVTLERNTKGVLNVMLKRACRRQEST